MNENENITTQNLWDSIKSGAKGKVHSNTSLPQETREKSNNLTLYLKQLEKEEGKKKKPKLVEGKKS